MSLTTYAGLKTAAATWIERVGATEVTDIIDDCVILCESRINKVPDLRVQAMETEPAAITLTAGSGALPTDFLALKSVVANTSPVVGLDYADPFTYKRKASPFTSTSDDFPLYTIIGTTIRSLSSATLSIIYYAKVPPLATAVNWLLTKAPEVYLYGTILELAIALERDDTDKWGTLFAGAIQGLITSETFNRSGQMVKQPSGPFP